MKIQRGMKPKQPTVRVNAAAKEKLDRMQGQTDLSEPALMDRAIQLLERELMAEQMKSDFEAIAHDPETLAQYKTIASVFAGTISS